jgi:hypothetical protein
MYRYLIFIAIFLSAASIANGQNTAHRAGLVVQYGDGQVQTACVSFAEDEVTGVELLERADLPIVVQEGGVGAAVCKIGGDGCDYPAEQCFCERDGPRSIYWALYQLEGQEWRYSNLGAGSVRVRDGDVFGWAWGIGESGEGAVPPVITLEELCQQPSTGPTTAALQRPTAQQLPTRQPIYPLPSETETLPYPAVGTGFYPAGGAQEVANQANTTGWLVFGGLALLLIGGIGLRLWQRGRG